MIIGQVFLTLPYQRTGINYLIDIDRSLSGSADVVKAIAGFLQVCVSKMPPSFGRVCILNHNFT